MEDRCRAHPAWALVSFVSALVAAGCGGRAAPDAPPRFLNQDRAVRYVGGADCVGCHRDKADTFAHTGMGRSFYRWTAEGAVEDFTQRNRLDVESQGVHYAMEQRDGKFFMRQSVPDGRGGEIAADEREMVWVLGSGNHSRSYLTVADGKLFQAPVCWYPEPGVWDLCPGYEEKNDHFSREIGETCVFCHNARMTLVDGQRNRYLEPIPQGIDCERCHGPGELHVRRWRSGSEEPDDALDPTIVNPARLAPRERIQICFQCHLGDSKATERVQREDRTLADHRPGSPLTDAMVPFYFRTPHEHDFGLSAQGDRLLRSRCYQASGGKIECLTCHDPHVTVYRKDRPASLYRDPCLGCHATEDCKAPVSERAATAPLPDDCVACHMPRVEPDDHRHTRFTDHWIRKPAAAGAGQQPLSTELVPVLPDAFAALPAAEREYYRARAYFLKSLAFPDPVRASMWRAGEEGFKKAIASGFDTADAWFFLGKILRYERRPQEAVAAFARALERDPSHHDAAMALGTELAALGRIAESSRVLEGMLARWPDDPGAMAELARSKVAAAPPTDDVLTLYDRAAAAEPWNAGFQLNRALILQALGRGSEAASACRDALRLEPGDARLWTSCSEVFRAGGLEGDAVQAERRAGFLLGSTRKPVG